MKLRDAIYTNIIPSSLTLLVEFGVIWSNIVFISMLNNATLISAWGLGNTTIALVILSIDIGLWGGIDTLVSQAFGRKQYYLWGVYLNSARIVIWLLFIVQWVILLNWDFLFKLINQPPEIIELSQQYIFSVIPGVFLQMQYEWLRRFLMSLGIFAPTLYIMASVLIIHVAMLYLFLIVYEMEILGVGIATSISGALWFWFLTLYVHLNKKLIPRESWNWFDKASIFKIVEFLKIGIPSCLMVLLDSWPYEVYTIYSGWLGVHQQAWTVIIYNLQL